MTHRTVQSTYKLNESDCHFKILDHQVLIGHSKTYVLTRPDRMVLRVRSCWCHFSSTCLKKKEKREKRT